jgi:antitoxin component of RelBE/YafQ-DinJ toxin-antitoxin module
MAKNDFITIRASSSDRKALEDVAKAYGLNKSEVLRFLLRREIRDLAIYSDKPKESDQLRIFEL